MSIEESIAHNKRLAAEARATADWQDSLGQPYGSTQVHRNRADMFDRTARSLELELETGEVHCVCHLAPESQWAEIDRREGRKS